MLFRSGSDAGHNGLRSIQDILGHNLYARLRFGIGSDFPRGGQVRYVLGKWDKDELASIPERAGIAIEMISSFCLTGLELTMTQFNKK